MLKAGKSKVTGKRVRPVAGDAMSLPLATGSMSGAIVAFGVRNVSNLDGALRETHRVLEPGARFVILEFSTPRSPLVNAGYQIYFRYVLPAIGGLISGNRAAYRYLPRSVANFPVTEELARRMRAAGFQKVRWRSLTFGIAAIHVAEK
jgi:demethylmenaquinone methyltransferase/2-methoxy-6-polyprenyl-1,4-benzoquinol methylase